MHIWVLLTKTPSRTSFSITYQTVHKSNGSTAHTLHLTVKILYHNVYRRGLKF